MRKEALFAVLAITATTVGTDAMAVAKCHIGSDAIETAGGYGKAVEAAVRNASDCERTYAVLADCQLGSSGDNALADIVQSKCERLFMHDASAAAKKAYKRAQSRCDRIAAKNEGSMYQGFAAVCRAKAARDFARKH